MKYEGHLRGLTDDVWFHVHRNSNPTYWGYWIMVLP